MNSRLRFTLSALMWAAILIAAYAASVHAQNGAKDNHQRSDKGLVTQAGPNSPVQGIGTVSPSVARDATLEGNGTSSSQLRIASGQIVRSLNGLTDNVTLAAGPNISLTPEGNTVTIGSTVVDPTKNAFQTKILLRILPNEANTTDSLDIPAGKRFVIEYITMNGFSNDLDDLFFPVRFITVVGGVQASHQIQPVFFNRFASGADKQVRIYADAPKLFFGWQRNGSGDAFMSVTMSGYIVDLP